MDQIDLNELDRLSSKSYTIESDFKEDHHDYEEENRIELLRQQKLMNDALEEANMGSIQDRIQRKEFADRIFRFVGIYLLFIAIFIFLSGTRNNGFTLSDTVLATLLGTTTANIVGLLVIVVTYLFYRKKQ